MTNLYSILGVTRDVKEQALKKAYRTLAKKYHPDLHPGNHTIEAKFKEINEAYEILSNPVKRSRYDLESNKFTDRKSYSSEESSCKKSFEPNDFGKSFEQFFGFDPKSETISKEESVTKPFDTTALFKKYMGF